jgi:Domain of Unknown Function (DUF928)
MIQPTLVQPLTLFSLALCLGLGIVSSLLTQVQAQSEPENPAQALLGRSFANVTFDPPGDGQPDDTAGGASRGGGCPVEVTNLGGCIMPVMPITKTGLTVAEHPTLFIYVPATSANALFFSLRDENNNHLYQTEIPLTGKSGIVSVKLPDNAPGLEIGKSYRWAFALIGSEGLKPDSPGVEGKIKRVELNLAPKSELEMVKPLERAVLYGKNGVWYDTVTALAEALRSQPNDANLAAAWEDLLKSVGLNAIATQPLL